MTDHKHSYKFVRWESEVVEGKGFDGEVKGERTRLARFACDYCSDSYTQWVRV